MAWVTWASSSLACLLKAAGRGSTGERDLDGARPSWNAASPSGRPRLRASQARVIQQEKMAAFGLLAAGIAHEVGNPLAALSSLVQMLQRRRPDPYTAEKLDLADRQLGRIQRTIRELVDFSRPASTVAGRVRLAEVVEEALGIAKYYQRTSDRALTTDVPADLPPVARGPRPPDPGRPEPRPQRHRRDRHGGRIHVDGPRGPGRVDALRSRTTAGGSRRPTAPGSSSRTSPPSRTGRASACSSAGRSSRRWAGRSTSRPSPAGARPSPSASPPPRPSRRRRPSRPSGGGLMNAPDPEADEPGAGAAS